MGGPSAPRQGGHLLCYIRWAKEVVFLGKDDTSVGSEEQRLNPGERVAIVCYNQGARLESHRLGKANRWLGGRRRGPGSGLGRAPCSPTTAAAPDSSLGVALPLRVRLERGLCIRLRRS